MSFAKLSKQLLHGIRVDSRKELERRIRAYLGGLNEVPVPFRWRWKSDADDAHVI